MFVGTFSTIYKGEGALTKKHPRKIWSQIASSKTLEGANKAAKKYGISRFYIIKATDRNRYYVYV